MICLLSVCSTLHCYNIIHLHGVFSDIIKSLRPPCTYVYAHNTLVTSTICTYILPTHTIYSLYTPFMILCMARIGLFANPITQRVMHTYVNLVGKIHVSYSYYYIIANPLLAIPVLILLGTDNLYDGLYIRTCICRNVAFFYDLMSLSFTSYML